MTTTNARENGIKKTKELLTVRLKTTIATICKAKAAQGSMRDRIGSDFTSAR
jgi:hypothetical protein